MEWYYLDPDNRIDDPEVGLFCARCKKKLKDQQAVTSFVSIILHETEPYFRKAAAFEKVPKELHALIGRDCFVKVMVEHGVFKLDSIG